MMLIVLNGCDAVAGFSDLNLSLGNFLSNLSQPVVNIIIIFLLFYCNFIIVIKLIIIIIVLITVIIKFFLLFKHNNCYCYFLNPKTAIMKLIIFISMYFLANRMFILH